MALGTGTHWEGPLLGSDRAQGGLLEEMCADLNSRRNRWGYFYDFIRADDFTTADWTATQIAANGGVGLQIANGGLLRITSGAVDNDGEGSVQTDGVIPVVPSTNDTPDGLANRICAFGARVSIADWSASSWYIGLAGGDTTLMAATSLLTATGGDNCVGFHHVAEAQTQGGILGPDLNDVRLISAGGGVANYQGTLLSAAQNPRSVPVNATVDGVFHEFGVKIIGVNMVEYYLNGVLRHRRVTSNNFSTVNGQTISFANVCTGGADNNMDIDYVWMAGTR